MLPPQVIERYTLAEGRDCPAVSLYLDINPLSHLVEGQETRVERVNIAANLRHHQVEALDAAFLAGEERGELPFEAELFFLWRLALELEAARGKPATQQDRVDYNFYVENERVSIVERRRGAPLDKLVAELMISANNNWGRLLADRGVPAIYRTQSNGKVRMTTVRLAAPGSGRVALHLGEFAAAPLHRSAEPVAAARLPVGHGAAVRKEFRRSARGDARIRTDLRGLRPVPEQRWSITGACAGCCRSR